MPGPERLSIVEQLNAPPSRAFPFVILLMIPAVLAGIWLISAIPFPGRYHVTAIYEGRVLLRVDTWTGQSWTMRVDKALGGDSPWVPAAPLP